MKILRKGDDFKKMSERDLKDVLAIENLVNQGWNYCAKEIYKDFFNKNIEKKKPELNIEEKKKKEDSVKTYNKPEKKKIERKTKADKRKKN